MIKKYIPLLLIATFSINPMTATAHPCTSLKRKVQTLIRKTKTPSIEAKSPGDNLDETHLYKLSPTQILNLEAGISETSTKFWKKYNKLRGSHQTYRDTSQYQTAMANHYFTNNQIWEAYELGHPVAHKLVKSKMYPPRQPYTRYHQDMDVYMPPLFHRF